VFSYIDMLIVFVAGRAVFFCDDEVFNSVARQSVMSLGNGNDSELHEHY